MPETPFPATPGFPVVQIVLGIYAILLAVGGAIGYLKAGSQASLIAGLGSAVVALVALGLTLAAPTAGLIVGAVLAFTLLVLFGRRFAKGRKFMPSGLLGIVSLMVLAFLSLQIAGVGR